MAILLWIGWYEDPATTSAPTASAATTGVAVAASEPAVTPEPAKTAADDGATKPASLMAEDTAVAEDKAAAAKKPAAKKPAAKKPAAKKVAPEKKPVAAKPAAKKTAAKSTSTAKTAAKTTKPAKVEKSEPAPTTKAAAAKSAKAPAKAKAAAKPAAKTAAKRAPVAADGTPDNLLKKARAGGADDLKMIKGVGPKLEGTLNDLGIYHYDQVAALRKKEREWLDDRLKFKGRIDRDDWVGQAKKLAKGEQTEFSKRAKY